VPFGNSSKLLWIGASLPIADIRIDRALESVEIFAEPSLREGLDRLASGEFAVAVLSAASFRGADNDALEQLLRQDPRFPVIVHDASGTLDDAISLTRRGAFYVLLGEIDPQRLENAVKMALERHRPKPLTEIDALPWRRLVVGQSRAVQHICEVIQLVASKRCTVLIGGETGTGKEVIAKAIHAASNRSARSMVSVNCTALPANLIETELFGHAKGAFTGAHGSRIGRFEQANRGTIFLDEIGDLPIDAQAKLLRVLQEQEFQRLGSSETVRVDVRVLAASNINLEEAVQQRRFREDLFYRLNVVPIRIPPLRERREDIPLLLDHFLEKIQAAEGGAAKRISPQAIDLLMTLEWPGNVRQLEHTVHMAFALAGERQVLYPADFSSARPLGRVQTAQPERPVVTVPQEGLDFDEAVSRFELSLLNQALAVSGGNKARAADLLRIKRTTLLAKMKTLEERVVSVTNTKLARVPPRPAALVFEPDGSVRKLISKALDQDGYRVLQAATGSVALDLFQCWSNQIGLVVIRAGFPENAEHDVITRFRSLAGSTPILIVAENDCSPQIDPGQQTQILPCPFSSEDLLLSVRRLISVGSAEFANASCA
jgi:DNA-binding NtrC family response regulator